MGLGLPPRAIWAAPEGGARGRVFQAREHPSQKPWAGRRVLAGSHPGSWEEGAG